MDWKDGLPDDLKGNAALSQIPDVATLAKNYVGSLDWKGGLPDDLKADPSLAAIQDVPSLAKSYVSAQKLVGAKGIILPGENATPEEMGAFFNQLGRPEAPNGYEITRPQLPDGVPYNEAVEGKFREIAHQMGLNGKQFAGLYDWYVTHELDGYQAAVQVIEQQKQETEGALRKELGVAYDKKLELARRAVKKFAGDEQAAAVLEEGLGNDLRLARIFIKVGEAIGEDTLLGAGGGPGGGPMTPAEARAEIAKITGDAKSPYFDASHPQHKDVLDKVQRFYQMAYPQEKKE